MQVHLSRKAPGGEQRRGHISRARVARCQLGARRGVLPLLNRVNRGRKTREVVARIACQQSLAEGSCVLLVTVRERRRKCVLDKIRVSWVNSKRFAIINLGRGRVAIGAGDEPCKIITWLALADLERLRS